MKAYEDAYVLEWISSWSW